MCLKRIDNYGVRKKGMPMEEGFHVGYKFFRHIGREIQSYYFRKYDSNLKVGRWLDEKDFRCHTDDLLIRTDSNRYYNIGFHIFISSVVPLTYSDQILRKVFFRNIVTAGWEDYWSHSKSVVVAKEMFIVPLRGLSKGHKINLHTRRCS